MAVTGTVSGYRMTAANDVLDNATVGHVGQGTTPFRVRVTAINIISSGGSGAVTIRNGGASGTIIYTSTTGAVANATTSIVFTEPTEFEDLAVSQLPANVTLTIAVT